MITPHLVFWAFGIILVLVAVILRLIGGTELFWQFWADLSLNVGVSVMAVSIVDFLWRKLGGDPIMAAIHRLHTVTALLRDLEESGIERVYARRDLFQGKEALFALMKTSHEIDLMGITLQHGWANDPEFLGLLKTHTGRGKCHFRIMVFQPDSAVVRQRDKEEAEAYNPKSGRISNDASTSLNIFSEICAGLPEEERAFLEVRAVRETNMYCSIIRADEKMLVTKYLMSCRGSKSPTFEIEGSSSPFFRVFTAEFNNMWKLAVEWPPTVGAATY